jgi:hypothetical protein
MKSCSPATKGLTVSEISCICGVSFNLTVLMAPGEREAFLSGESFRGGCDQGVTERSDSVSKRFPAT